MKVVIESDCIVNLFRQYFDSRGGTHSDEECLVEELSELLAKDNPQFSNKEFYRDIMKG
jgi:hypothetical protein